MELAPQTNRPFTLEIVVDRAVQNVYDFLADARNMPLWYEAVEEVRELPTQAGTTARFLITRRLPGGPARNEVEIEEESPDTLTMRSLNGPTPFTYRYSLTPTGGRTRLVLTGSISAAGLTGLAGLAAPLAQRIFSAGMARNLAVLRALLEHRRQSSAVDTARATRQRLEE